MGTVHYFGGITKLDLPADRILEQNIGELEGVLIMGYNKQGQFIAASSYADGGLVLWLMEQCKHELLKHGGIIEC